MARGRLIVGGLAAASATTLLLCAISPMAFAQTTTSTTDATTPAVSTTGGPVISLSGDSEIAFVSLLLFLFSFIWVGLTFYDRYTTTRYRQRIEPTLIKLVESSGAKERTPADIEALAKVLREPPRGIRGLTRTLLALGLLTLIALALLALLVGNGENASELLKTVVTSLTAALTTVIGFYFGARTSDDSNSPSGPTTPLPPSTNQNTDGDVGTDADTATDTNPPKT